MFSDKRSCSASDHSRNMSAGYPTRQYTNFATYAGETVFTMQNLPPEGQTLYDVRVLLAMIMCQSRTAPSTANRQVALLILCLGRVEVFLQILNHAFTRIAVGAEERVIIANGVQALPDLLLRKSTALILGRQFLNGHLFTPYIALYFAASATL